MAGRAVKAARGLRRLTLLLAGLALAAAASPARACAVCAPSAPLTVAQRLIDAERALLAHPEPGAPGGWRETDQSPTSATLGDGGVYSSLEDLAKWDESLRRNTLLNEADLRPALEPVQVPAGPPVGPDGTPASYGFGWFLNPWKGHPRMWHYGETIGFRTAIQRFPGEKLTVVVLANRSDLDAAALALKVSDFYLER